MDLKYINMSMDDFGINNVTWNELISLVDEICGKNVSGNASAPVDLSGLISSTGDVP